MTERLLYLAGSQRGTTDIEPSNTLLKSKMRGFFPIQDRGGEGLFYLKLKYRSGSGPDPGQSCSCSQCLPWVGAATATCLGLELELLPTLLPGQHQGGAGVTMCSVPGLEPEPLLSIRGWRGEWLECKWQRAWPAGGGRCWGGYQHWGEQG